VADSRDVCVIYPQTIIKNMVIAEASQVYFFKENIQDIVCLPMAYRKLLGYNEFLRKQGQAK
jgi:hypothetical protein